MDSKLRDKIAEALAVQGVTDGYICDKTKAIADSILSLLASEFEKARKLDHIAILIDNFPGRPKYPQIMEAINLLRKIEGIVKEAT